MAYQYLDSTGTIVPETSTILAEVQAEYKSVFGADLVVTADTPQGVLITAEALSRDEVVNNNAALANEINPNIAGGIFLDATMSLTGIQRTPATQTVVSGVALTGVAGTVIPSGTQAKTAANDLFATLTTVTLDVSGNATVDFASVEYGAIPCASSALNTIVTNVLGWETVTNSTAGVLGSSTQSDQGARALRNNTLGFQGVALPVAMTSALYAVSGVKSLFFQENIAATTQTINGISMISHSIYACVYGGSDLDVASSMLENKSSGCGWNGSTTVDVIEPASGQTYEVKFDRPAEIGILVKVTTTNGSTANITQAILDYANGLISGFPGFVVGADVSPWEIAGAITTVYPSYYISKVELSLVSPVSYSTDSIPIAVNEVAYTQNSYITIVVS